MVSVKILDALVFELLPDGRRVSLFNALRVRIEDKFVNIPVGFVTDFASIPKVFWPILSPWGKYSPAAVVHDYLYYSGTMSRRMANDVFSYLMLNMSVSAWKARVMHLAVRMFGGIAWKTHRRRQLNGTMD